MNDINKLTKETIEEKKLNYFCDTVVLLTTSKSSNASEVMIYITDTLFYNLLGIPATDSLLTVLGIVDPDKSDKSRVDH